MRLLGSVRLPVPVVAVTLNRVLAARKSAQWLTDTSSFSPATVVAM
jgi:hypothetical protein